LTKHGPEPGQPLRAQISIKGQSLYQEIQILYGFSSLIGQEAAQGALHRDRQIVGIGHDLRKPRLGELGGIPQRCDA
jgi:hypothetical protein